MVVSPAVLAHNVSTRAGDVSMGIAVVPIGCIRLTASTFDKRSANEKEGEIPQARELRVDT